jgi:transcriptional regulator with GAF, ATPase, and Fis domain
MSAGEPRFADTTPITTADAESLLRARGARHRPLLLVYHRDHVETVRLHEGAELVVGREPPADIAISDGSLSRRHARFTLHGDTLTVEDLGSTNGTRVGRRRVTREVLKPGDEVTLGAVTIAVHVLPGADSPFLDLDGDDAFRTALDAELARCRFFGRSLALVTVRALDAREGHVRKWSPRVRGLLRPVDRIGLYSAHALQILLPEMALDAARALAEAVVRRADGEPRLGAGLAFFPGAAASADALLEQSRRAALAANADAPVKIAATEGAREIAAGPEGEDEALIAKSPSFRAVVELAQRTARSAVPVLLLGETGAGKEVLARLIHEAGPRREKPMICVNCGAIPSQLVESTLFGHERGAFTGAVQQHRGVFEAADGGTVLLDEIGELPAAAQAALLRVLESKRLSRVGATKEIEVEARVIAATHRDIEAMASSGAFRADLYYRLSVMVLEVPPLRRRREDIPLLAARFLRQAAIANGCQVRAIAPEATSLLSRYPWPGNVRELRNVIERAVVIAEGDTITEGLLPERLRAAAGIPAPAAAAPEALRQAEAPAPAPPRSAEPAPAAEADSWKGGLRELLDRHERSLLIKALREAGGNQAEAAQRLDVPLRTLQHRLKAHGIRKSGYQVDPAKE